MSAAVSMMPAAGPGAQAFRGDAPPDAAAGTGEAAFLAVLSQVAGGSPDASAEAAQAEIEGSQGELRTESDQATLTGVSLLAALMGGGALQAGAPSASEPVPEGVAEIADQLRALADAQRKADDIGTSEEEALAAVLPKASVVRRETHLAPAAASEALAGGAQPLEDDVAAMSSDGAADRSGARQDSRARTAPEEGAPNAQPAAELDEGPAAVRKEAAALPQPTSATDQIGERLVRSAPAPAPATAGTQAAHTAPGQAAPAVKVLHIELQPADLGTVTVRMSLKDDALEVRIDAAREETARLLLQDRDRLSDILRSAGYQVDSVSVRVAEPDRLQSASAASQGFQGPAQQQPGSAQPDARSPGGRPGHDTDQPRPAASGSQAHETDNTDRSGSDLYV